MDAGLCGIPARQELRADLDHYRRHTGEVKVYPRSGLGAGCLPADTGRCSLARTPEVGRKEVVKDGAHSARCNRADQGQEDGAAEHGEGGSVNTLG